LLLSILEGAVRVIAMECDTAIVAEEEDGRDGGISEEVFIGA
jgi:hypothetical protein